MDDMVLFDVLPTRVVKRLAIDAETGCWLWLGARSRDGYGRIQDNGKPREMHRWMLEHFRGPIGPGLSVDHLCRVRACCNPAHLEAVTHRTNILRGNTTPGRNAAKTECIRGHPFDETNTRIRSNGWRVCRACQRASANRRMTTA